MTKLDWDIAEHNRILDEMQHRTEVENQAFGLMAEGKFLEAKELVETLDDSLLEFQEWPGEEESDNPETNVRDTRHTAKEATQAIMKLSRAAIKIRKTARKEDIHLKVKVKGNENVSEEELKEVQEEIAVAINKANRNRNKKISYKIVIQTPLSDGKALPEDYDMQQKKPSYRQKHL